jgi:hypothetical protein
LAFFQKNFLTPCVSKFIRKKFCHSNKFEIPIHLNPYSQKFNTKFQLSKIPICKNYRKIPKAQLNSHPQKSQQNSNRLQKCTNKETPQDPTIFQHPPKIPCTQQISAHLYCTNDDKSSIKGLPNKSLSNRKIFLPEKIRKLFVVTTREN